VITGCEPVAERLGPPLIELAGVEKVYRTGKVEFRALRGVDLSIAAAPHPIDADKYAGGGRHHTDAPAGPKGDGGVTSCPRPAGSS